MEAFIEAPDYWDDDEILTHLVSFLDLGVIVDQLAVDMVDMAEGINPILKERIHMEFERRKMDELIMLRDITGFLLSPHQSDMQREALTVFLERMGTHL